MWQNFQNMLKLLGLRNKYANKSWNTKKKVIIIPISQINVTFSSFSSSKLFFKT